LVGSWFGLEYCPQSEVLAEAVHQFPGTAARHGIAVVLTDFPGLVTDTDKAWAALGPVLAGHVISEQFRQRYAKRAIASKLSMARRV
jgi:hypothetical protein